MLAWVGWFQLFPNPKNEGLPHLPPNRKANPKKGGQPQVKDGRTANINHKKGGPTPKGKTRSGKQEKYIDHSPMCWSKHMFLNVCLEVGHEARPLSGSVCLVRVWSKARVFFFFFSPRVRSPLWCGWPGLALLRNGAGKDEVCGRSCYERSCVFEIPAAPP